MEYTVESDIGLKRSINEDRAAFFKRPDGLALALVADGMGGHNAGDVASDMAIQQMESFFLQADTHHFVSTTSKKEWLLQTVQQLNKTIYDYSLSHEDCKGMGTTFIAVLIEEQHCFIAHVGDSRVYYFFEDGAQQITRDHSYVNVLVENGEISEEEALTHPKKNFILKAVGTEETIEPDFYEVDLASESYLLICSDGLSNKLTVYEMASIITYPDSIEEKGRKLVELANASGGEDNISLVLLTKKDEEV
ncbi:MULTISPECIES: Stp1/IreP family PP2C-type Ser/Thr phosphatase [Lysinibacillus]|uniref:Protein phosphatase n=1 Tax=Lysinibacillus boronitolerans JCM 21713 = 10a = NBRC 103108 TaxID=1294264 RepID=A0ABR4Y201_9BACI|nr:Stp1/IreP family PP2C-type Ser/Thr phosphatase [Lysinibacillus boronitolerans]KGR86374.1 protein phosphatase [Lysinibacillus boronitolerans JCM 21713 = 10a = NBRC 103108]MCS1391550.1 Stp1/IreP family PP2C-type Ser/Thr phosphatase [Lysinibacillus boronitolerans]